jgi:hypothetical protein
MGWKRDVLERLAATVPSGYFATGEAASEPTALAGLALVAASQTESARAAADWLLAQQSDAGTVGVTATQPHPCWTTSLAILLWHALDDSGRYGAAVEKAVAWTLAERGLAQARRPFVGHDSTLVGWSWAANTHSWSEPTALFVLALKAVGLAEHERTREAVRLLVDRLLPAGGCNYGNTLVLGQELLPHVEPTGLVMMALAGESVGDSRIGLSLEYLEREVSAETTTASLCYGLLGLGAHDRGPELRRDWLQTAYRRTIQLGSSPHKLALVALAMAEPYPLRR